MAVLGMEHSKASACEADEAGDAEDHAVSAKQISRPKERRNRSGCPSAFEGLGGVLYGGPAAEVWPTPILSALVHLLG